MILQNNINYFDKHQVHFKGGDSGDSFDAAYNARMATIAEQQQDMATEYFDFWKSDYQPMEQAQIAANIKEIPYQSDLNIAQIEGQQELLPGQIEAGKAANKLNVAKSGADLSILPGATDLTLEQIAAQRRLLPGQTALSELQIADTTAGIQERAPVRSAFYKSALDGINVDQRVSDASADVMHSFKNADSINRRNIARTGVNPNSGRYEGISREGSLDMARGVAGAKTQARSLAELEKFGRLQGAMGVA